MELSPKQQMSPARLKSGGLAVNVQKKDLSGFVEKVSEKKEDPKEAYLSSNSLL